MRSAGRRFRGIAPQGAAKAQAGQPGTDPEEARQPPGPVPGSDRVGLEACGRDSDMYRDNMACMILSFGRRDSKARETRPDRRGLTRDLHSARSHSSL